MALNKLTKSPFVKDFTVIVQFSAILSVLVLYRRRLHDGGPLYVKLLAKDLTYVQALLIGLVQCLAFIPGTSRSAAAISEAHAVRRSGCHMGFV